MEPQREVDPMIIRALEQIQRSLPEFLDSIQYAPRFERRSSGRGLVLTLPSFGTEVSGEIQIRLNLVMDHRVLEVVVYWPRVGHKHFYSDDFGSPEDTVAAACTWLAEQISEH